MLASQHFNDSIENLPKQNQNLRGSYFPLMDNNSPIKKRFSVLGNIESNDINKGLVENTENDNFIPIDISNSDNFDKYFIHNYFLLLLLKLNLHLLLDKYIQHLILFHK